MKLFNIFNKQMNKEENAEDTRNAISNNIEYLLEKASSEPELRPQFYKKLLTSELIVLTKQQSNIEGVHILEEDEEVQIISMSDGKIPVFTSTGRIFDRGVIKSKVPFMGMDARSLLEMTEGATLVINPFSRFGKELTPHEIQELLNGNISNLQEASNTERIELKKNTRIRTGRPAQIPDGMDISIIEFAKAKTEIDAVYIAMVEHAESGEMPSLLIALRTNGNEQQIFKELGEIICPFISKGQHINMMKINGSDGLSGYFDTDEPIYKR